MQIASNAGIGSGKCIEFQNQNRFSSASRRASWNSAWYGYISSHPSQPGGVAISYGLGNAEVACVDAVMASPPSELTLACIQHVSHCCEGIPDDDGRGGPADDA